MMNREMQSTMVIWAILAGISTADEAPRALLTFSEPALTHMPIWVYVSLPDEEPFRRMQMNIRYPFSSEPGCFGLNREFEVMRDGRPVSKRGTFAAGCHVWNGPSGGSAAPQSSPKGRFPLHVQYQFDQPGTYSVRFILYEETIQHRRPVIVSDWTDLKVQASTAEHRGQWIERMRENPPKDIGQLVGDYLPSLLACPDERTLPMILDHVHSSDRLVEGYAVYSLYYFDEELQRRKILSVIQKRGANYMLAHYLSWQRTIFEPVGAEIVNALLPFLNSESPNQVGGSLRSLSFMRAYSWNDHPDVPGQMEKAVFQAAPHIMKFEEPEALNPFCVFLGGVKSKEAGDLLWKLCGRPRVAEQARICLGWIDDPRAKPSESVAPAGSTP